MRERLRCEFSLIRYVPDVVKGEFANIGVVLRDDGGQAAVRFTRNWSRVRCLDPDADTELLEALEAELSAALDASGLPPVAGAKPLLDVLGDTLSNSVQMTAMRATLAESLPAEMEQLLRLYVEPLRRPTGTRAAKGRAAKGLTAIQREMRAVFERAGVWGLMRKKIAAAAYTQAGDPLRIDCGYRNGRLRLFQAVSLDSEAESAKGLAYSYEDLRAGIERVEGAELELTAVVEPIAQVSDAEVYGFGLATMEQARIRVLTVADLSRVAETARRELGVG